jgi:Domain of unknown function (DUF4389)
MSDTDSGTTQPTYPVAFDVTRQLSGRNRLTTGFRIILAVPHMLLAGGAGLGLGVGFERWAPSGSALGTAAAVMAVIAWFALVFAAVHPRGLWDFAAFYLRWRARSVPYLMLLRDEYPPFGDGDYPTTLEVDWPAGARDRLSIGLRILYAIPHVIVLVFVNIAWLLTSIVAWFAILFTGSYPAGLYEFAVGVLRWDLRVEAYLLLMRDEYPPFTLAS